MAELTAKYIVNYGLKKKSLEFCIFRYGEEKVSRRIARVIVGAREKLPLQTTGELAELIKEGIPAAAAAVQGDILPSVVFRSENCGQR